MGRSGPYLHRTGLLTNSLRVECLVSNSIATLQFGFERIIRSLQVMRLSAAVPQWTEPLTLK
jgi:hypothetical protein